MTELTLDKAHRAMPEAPSGTATRRGGPIKTLVVLGLIGGGAWAAYHFVASRPHATPPAAPPIVTAVDTAKAQRGDVPVLVSGLGTIQPFNSVTVKPRVGGQIADIVFTEGQMVQAGQVLAHIDPRPFLAPLHQAEANLDKDQAQLANTGTDLKRTSNLAQKGYATSQALDTQKAALAIQQATIEADQAAVENARTQLDYATVVSPLAGIAGIRMIDAGNMISPSDPGFVVINQLEPISVVFTVPSEAIGRWAVGRPDKTVPVTALSPDNRRTLGEGTLSLVDNHIDPTTATIKLKATFPNKDHLLKPGQFVNARMQSVLLHDVLSIPSGAVQQGSAGPYVYLVQPDMKLAQRPVTVTRVVGAVSVIASGLAADDIVVTDGQYGLKPGATVSLAPPPGGPAQADAGTKLVN